MFCKFQWLWPYVLYVWLSFVEPAKATGSMISPLSGCSDVTNWSRKPLQRYFWNSAWSWGTIRVKKQLGPIFDKNSHFGRFWPNVPKNGQNHSFLDFAKKNNSNKFSKIALKVSPKIVLQDRIVILPKKISFQG